MSRRKQPHSRATPPRYERGPYLPWVVGAVGIALCTGLSLRATTPIATANYVPAYSARDGGYSEAILREMLVEVKLIKGEVRLMREQQTASAASPMTLPQLVSQRCASCHGEATYQADGAGFMLLTKAGELAPLNDAEKRRIRREINLNRMPKNSPPLSVAEKQIFLRALPLPEDKP